MVFEYQNIWLNIGIMRVVMYGQIRALLLAIANDNTLHYFDIRDS